MKRLFFFILLVASIGASVNIVLFVPGFWEFNPSGETGGAIPSGTGYDMLYFFFTNLSDWEWAVNVETFMIFALISFVVLSVASFLILTFILLLTLGNLNNSRRLYRNTAWFLSASLTLSGIYIWMVVDVINSYEGFSFGINTLPIWFYVPLGTAILSTIIGGVLRATEVND